MNNRIAKVATNNRASAVVIAAVSTTAAALISTTNNDDCNKSKNTNSSALQQQHHPSSTLLPSILYNNNKQNQQYCKCEASKTTLLDGFNNKYTEDKEDTNHHQNKQRALNIQRSRTLRILTSKAKSNTLSSLYTIDWDAPPMGEGAFGNVYMATNNATKQKVALKRIPKKLASREDFQREMEALLRIQKWGGHPHICALHEHFDEGGYYYLILDLVEGGEMFDHLVNHGAYSEADAARLVREVASALDFLHGIGVVHNDIKPENLMLSTVETRDGSIQLVDFGCAEVEGEDDDDDDHDVAEVSSARGGIKGNKTTPGGGGFTPAYSSPEAFEDRDVPPLPPADMWALGVIVYIMLTGVHPFDMNGKATDEEIEKDVRDPKKKLPIGPKHPFTRHLSPSAQDLIQRLMERNPKERLSAFEMLHHPWVTGETASTNIMAGSDKRLNRFRKFKTRLQTQFFTDAVGWSDEAILDDETRRRTSLIERSFKAIDGSEQAIKKLLSSTTANSGVMASESIVNHDSDDNSSEEQMTMSDYHDLLSENMKQVYFPKGHIVYNQGDEGNHMYFINSGTVSVITHEGIKNKRHAGDFFGEGALLHPMKIRSATIKCKTPVHVIEISREYFEKYMASSSGLVLSLREKDKIRKRNRAKALLKLQSGMKSQSFKYGDEVYTEGDAGDSLYIVEKGKLDVTTGGHQVIVAQEGNFCGEHSLLTGRLRNTTATCITQEGCVATRMSGNDFRKLMDASPHMKDSLVDMMNRRDFKKAVVLRLGKEFPYLNPREAFDAVDVKSRGLLVAEDVANLMRDLDKNYTDNEVQMMMQTLDLEKTGKISYQEFEKIFIGDIRTTQSM